MSARSSLPPTAWNSTADGSSEAAELIVHS
jgi:hypothetical protein